MSSPSSSSSSLSSSFLCMSHLRYNIYTGLTVWLGGEAASVVKNLRANVSMHQANSGKSPKFVFTPTFIFFSPIFLKMLHSNLLSSFLQKTFSSLKTLFLAHSCFQTRHSSFLEPACLPDTRILLCKGAEFV